MFVCMTHSTGWYSLIPQIVKNEGVKSFWKGNTAAVARIVPYMSCTFVAYEEYVSFGTGQGWSLQCDLCVACALTPAMGGKRLFRCWEQTLHFLHDQYFW